MSHKDLKKSAQSSAMSKRGKMNLNTKSSRSPGYGKIADKQTVPTRAKGGGVSSAPSGKKSKQRLDRKKRKAGGRTIVDEAHDTFKPKTRQNLPKGETTREPPPKERKAGGRVDPKTEVNVVVSPKSDSPAPPMASAPTPPMPKPMLPPGAAPGGMPGPAPAVPPGLPGMRPPMRRGGRVKNAGAGSGAGRLEKL